MALLLALDEAFDRGPLVCVHSWDRAPPDGAVTGTEVFTVVAQFGHSCA